jgi:hypothetical protein
MRGVVSLVCMLVFAQAACAEVFPVPDSVRQMRGCHEEVHVLRTVGDGTSLGEQRSLATVDNDVLALTIVTRFSNGEQWDERAEMDLRGGYRARAFHKVGRVDGKVVAEQRVDFSTGTVTWFRDGERGERTMALPPDTYIGPMLGVVLADVPDRSAGNASFQTIVFSPAPNVYTLRADVIDTENFRVGSSSEPTTKVRLKADLGPVQNVVFASLIPTHYFWFTRESPPEFFAFEGTLGYGGPELRMVPERPVASTARAG